MKHLLYFERAEVSPVGVLTAIECARCLRLVSLQQWAAGDECRPPCTPPYAHVFLDGRLDCVCGASRVVGMCGARGGLLVCDRPLGHCGMHHATSHGGESLWGSTKQTREEPGFA